VGRSKPPDEAQRIGEVSRRFIDLGRASLSGVAVSAIFRGTAGKWRVSHHVEPDIFLAEVVTPIARRIALSSIAESREIGSPITGRGGVAGAAFPGRALDSSSSTWRASSRPCSLACQLSYEFIYAARMPYLHQRGHLVAHQRDQRRDDDAGAVSNSGAGH